MTFGTAPPLVGQATVTFGVSHMMTYRIELTELEPQPAGVVREHVDVAGLPAFLGAAFGEVLHVLADQHLSPAGPPFARFHPSEGGFDVEAGFPASGPVAPSGRVGADQLPGGSVASVLHRSTYDAVAGAHQAVTDWLSANGYVGSGEPWESYLDGPEVSQPRTIVRMPCRKA